jgi:hypothetical protein
LAAFASSFATRAPRSSTIAAFTCGAADGGWTAGQPSIQPTPITSAAATAPEKGAITQGEIAGDIPDVPDGALAVAAGSAGCSDAACSGAGSACGLLSPGSVTASVASTFGAVVTSVASRSMVGGARLVRPASAGDDASC